MLVVSFNLVCDICKADLRGDVAPRTIYLGSRLFRRDVDGFRARAMQKGWARSRLKHDAPIRDYCPTCREVKP